MSFDWKQVVVTPQTTTKDALIHLDAAALRVVLVCDDAMLLVGVLTDGDVRRGLLRGIGLETPVSDIMNTSPITVEQGTPRREMLALMEQFSVLAIPIVKGGTLVGLQTQENINNPNRYENPVFIMAGGFGTRLRPLTNDLPKPMLKVGGRPVLETIVRQLKKTGFTNFYISTHYLPEVIETYFGDGSKWNVHIRYVYENVPLGTAGALSLLPDDLPNLPLLMINGDVLTSVDFERLLEFHNEQALSATMCVREYEYQIPYGVVTGMNQRITSIEEKPVTRCFVNAGIYVLDPVVYQTLSKNESIDMPTLVERYINEPRGVGMFPIHEYWLDIGQIDDFNQAQSDIKGLRLD